VRTTGHLYATQQLKKAKVLVLDQPATCVLEVTQEGGSFYFRPDVHAEILAEEPTRARC
jgi:hypothetical protein